eukprot:NODE_4450_length_1061_cov_131.733475_g4249_i0.p1 GENE.NODE_4450_length_1061_cov_131.733475_g4249_i0~~NODE_4450_length_1061_cov_131.733475_g4249_i0.p1  ORF type:complete len:292 (-),score=56.96 NODE_4450_length_1061_cov_131.733475_g4249_i0:124-999(-)
MDPRITKEVEKFTKKFNAGGGPKPRQFALPALLAGGALALYGCFYTVEPGHKAIKFNAITGLGEGEYGSGMHLKIPMLEWPIIYDCRTRPSEISSSSGSRDLQMVDLTLRVLYKPSSDLRALYRTLGQQYAQRVLPSVANEVMKAVLAQHNVADLLTKRSEVSLQISDHLTERCKAFHIDVSDVAIVHLTFGKEYSLAVEQKQVSQQQAERARFHVEQALQEKKSKIILAEGEAESAKLIGEAMRKHPGFIQLRELQAATEVAQILAESRNKVFLDADALMFGRIQEYDKK